MEIKLHIYNKKDIIKTYTADTYDVMFGTVEDLISLIDLDDIRTIDDIALIRIIGNLVMKSFDIIKFLLKDVFDGLTDEELKNTKVSEIISVLIEIVKFTTIQALKGNNSKN